VYEQELNEPTPEAVQALVQLIDSGKAHVDNRGVVDL
jgi:hypothetical protein